MDPQYTLVRIYLLVCQHCPHRLRAAAQRQSNNSDPDFTYEEVLTIYLFGIIEKRRTIREIYDYARDHFPDWFPNLPSYGGYNQRLNRMSAVFAPLVGETIKEVNCEDVVETVRIAGSMPIVMAKEKRSSQATVASEFADMSLETKATARRKAFSSTA